MSAQVMGLQQSKMKSRVVRSSIVERPLGQSEWNLRENFPVLQTDAGKKLEKGTWLSERSRTEGQRPFGGCRSEERLALTVQAEG